MARVKSYVLEGRVDGRTFASLLSAYQAMGIEITSRSGFLNYLLDDMLAAYGRSDLQFKHFTETGDALAFIEGILGSQARMHKVQKIITAQIEKEQEIVPITTPLFDPAMEHTREVSAEAREMLAHIEGGNDGEESLHNP